jgi:hypothetical protein
LAAQTVAPAIPDLFRRRSETGCRGSIANSQIGQAPQAAGCGIYPKNGRSTLIVAGKPATLLDFRPSAVHQLVRTAIANTCG